MDSEQDDLREFMMVLRQAMLMVVVWIEKRYGLKRKWADRSAQPNSWQYAQACVSPLLTGSPPAR